MSVCYQVGVVVYGANPERFSEIAGALRDQWGFTDALDEAANGYMQFLEHTNNTRYIPKELAQVLAQSVWTANGAYCQVDVSIDLVEQIPNETYQSYEEDYKARGKGPEDPKPEQ